MRQKLVILFFVLAAAYYIGDEIQQALVMKKAQDRRLPTEDSAHQKMMYAMDFSGWKAYFENSPNLMPKEGIVPNEKAVIAIAEAILVPLYGEETIRSERPLKAVEVNGIWYVSGGMPSDSLGGMAHVMISKKDGRILKIFHDK